MALFFKQGNDPTAFSVLTQALTGQMAFVDADYCATCGERGADKRCSLCKAVSQSLIRQIRPVLHVFPGFFMLSLSSR